MKILFIYAELSSAAQKFLITLNMDLCWELRCAVFFWGHDTTTVVGQVGKGFNFH